VSLLRPAKAREAQSTTAIPAHRTFDQDDVWRSLPGFSKIDATTFLDWKWQSQHSVRDVAGLAAVLGNRAPTGFLDDVSSGLTVSPMRMRVTPHTLSLIDWDDPLGDPIRRQFIPVESERETEHPAAGFDALAEQEHAPVPGLVHRYPDRVLFVSLDRCPVYCRYCTRSYAIGDDTEAVSKRRFGARNLRWPAAFAYIAAHPAIEDVVVSGGDAAMLRAEELTRIVDALLAIPSIRRIRLATKGLAVMPMKLLTDHEWTGAIIAANLACRRRGVELAMHTHIAHPRELTGITERAAGVLWDNGVLARNQAVVLRGVNDDAPTLIELVRGLGWLHVHPYYLYQHDFVPGVESLRTSLSESIELEKTVRGATAGFNTPTFVVDLPGGGGKRDLHSFESYDRATGISAWRSPNVDPEARYLYLDPLHSLTAEMARRWAEPAEAIRMLAAARAG
jgi:lysine 2,3-aminomutase